MRGGSTADLVNKGLEACTNGSSQNKNKVVSRALDGWGDSGPVRWEAERIGSSAGQKFKVQQPGCFDAGSILCNDIFKVLP